jgi:hypothetical protein
MTRVGPALLSCDRDGRVNVRHWRQPDRPGVWFTREEWESFLFGVNSHDAEHAKLLREGVPEPASSSGGGSDGDRLGLR